MQSLGTCHTPSALHRDAAVQLSKVHTKPARLAELLMDFFRSREIIRFILPQECSTQMVLSVMAYRIPAGVLPWSDVAKQISKCVRRFKFSSVDLTVGVIEDASEDRV